MQQRIIDQLIITAGQWNQFREQQYKQQFATLFDQLQQVTGKNYEEAEKLLLAHVDETEVAA